jgi:hypothetical protein
VWEDVKPDAKETGWEREDSVDLARDSNQWRTVVYTGW